MGRLSTLNTIPSPRNSLRVWKRRKASNHCYDISVIQVTIREMTTKLCLYLITVESSCNKGVMLGTVQVVVFVRATILNSREYDIL